MRGIAIDMQTGGRDGSITKIYKWMMEHAWRYGFVRTVRSERWHWQYKGGEAGMTMFKYVAKSHSTWNNYFTMTVGESIHGGPVSVPADSAITDPRDTDV